jgi:hypothetical protein
VSFAAAAQDDKVLIAPGLEVQARDSRPAEPSNHLQAGRFRSMIK